MIYDKENRKQRIEFYNRKASPTPDSPLYDRFLEITNLQLKDKKFNKQIEKTINESMSIWRTQQKNGIDLLMDNEIRTFLLEYNNRIHEHGLGSLPSSFNILEAFFKFNKKIFHFELYYEEFYLLSFYDFVDFITSKNFNKSFEQVYENLKDEIIYTYNFLNNFRDLSFSTADGKMFVFGGVSLIKRLDEITIFIVGGEQIDENSDCSRSEEHTSELQSHVNLVCRLLL